MSSDNAPGEGQRELPDCRPSMAVRLGRGACIILILAVGTWSLRSWGFLFAPQRQESPPSSQLETGVRDPASLVNGEGSWSFDGVPFDFSLRTVEPESVDTILRQPVARAVFRKETLPCETQLVQLLADFGVPSTQFGGGRLFEVTERDLKVAVRTLQALDTERIQFARLALRSEGKWAMLEFDFQFESSAPNDERPHLLPFPTQTRQVCCRRSGDGSVLLEIVKLEAQGEELLSGWRAAGWNIHNASDTDSATGMIHCVRREKAVTVFGMFGETTSEIQLVLIDGKLIRQ